jgi:peptide/nickel transport system permease protein
MSEPALLAELATPSLTGRGRVLRTFLGLPAARVGLVLTTLTVVVAALAPWLQPGDPFATVAEPFLSPSWEHPMGTDDLGRDLLHAVVHGARTSMVVVAWVVLLSSAIGIAVGSVAGYRGGLLDDVLMRVTEMFQSIPRFFLAILAVSLFGAGLDNLILVLALTSWTWLARVVRAEALSVKELEFVEAARAMGATDLRILFRHVLPSVLPSIMVVISLTAARVILLEASVAFLGLGDPQAMSWGYLANNAQRFLRIAWWMSLFPGVAIVVSVLGLNLLSDAVTDAHQPLTANVRPARSRRWRLRRRL